jgi:hypothetical protein
LSPAAAGNGIGGGGRPSLPSGPLGWPTAHPAPRGPRTRNRPPFCHEGGRLAVPDGIATVSAPSIGPDGEFGCRSSRPGCDPSSFVSRLTQRENSEVVRWWSADMVGMAAPPKLGGPVGAGATVWGLSSGHGGRTGDCRQRPRRQTDGCGLGVDGISRWSRRATMSGHVSAMGDRALVVRRCA